MSYLIRLVHVGSASFIFGGAALIFISLIVWSRHSSGLVPPLLDLMAAYEWGFWACIGLLIATGVGHLAHFGAALPGPKSDWGETFVVKMLLVFVFLFFSAIRSISLTLVQSGAGKTPRNLATLKNLYGATAVLIAGVLGLAVSLAHF